MPNEKYFSEVSEYGFRSVVPMPTQAELDKFYNDTYFNTPTTVSYKFVYPEKEIRHKRLNADATVRFIESNFNGLSNLKLLDIGCGEGFLLASALSKGWDVSGVDFQIAQIERHNPNVADHVSVINPTHHIESLIKSGSKFDVVIVQNVLEHVREPIAMLSKIKCLLKDQGKCVLQVPNDFSELQNLAHVENRINRDYWFSPPQHLHYFNVENIRRVADSVGFKIVDGVGDFPIEIFLFCNQENYVTDPNLGPLAHNARITLDLFFARNSLDDYLKLCRAFYEAGIGRNFCIMLSGGYPSEGVES